MVNPRAGKMAQSKANVSANMKDRFSAAKDTLSEKPNGLLGETTEMPEKVIVKITGDNEEKVILLPISKVLDNPYNARQIYDEDVVKLRAASIATHGQQEPAKVVESSEQPGHYFLIDGHYRKRGLLSAGKTEIKCLVRTVANELELYRLSFLLNEERSPQSSLDNAMAWRNLTNGNLVKTHEDIAELVGMSKGMVTKTLSLLTLPESVLQRMQEHPSLFGTTVAYEIVLIHKIHGDEKETLNLVQKVIDEGVSRVELQQIRERYESNPARKLRDVSRQHKIIVSGVEQGRLKEWDSGRLQLDVKIEDPKLRRELMDELKKRFNLGD